MSDPVTPVKPDVVGHPDPLPPEESARGRPALKLVLYAVDPDGTVRILRDIDLPVRKYSDG